MRCGSRVRACDAAKLRQDARPRRRSWEDLVVWTIDVDLALDQIGSAERAMLVAIATGHSLRGYAAVMGCSIATIERRKVAALDRLADELHERRLL